MQQPSDKIQRVETFHTLFIHSQLGVCVCGLGKTLQHTPFDLITHLEVWAVPTDRRYSWWIKDTGVLHLQNQTAKSFKVETDDFSTPAPSVYKWYYRWSPNNDNRMLSTTNNTGNTEFVYSASSFDKTSKKPLYCLFNVYFIAPYLRISAKIIF